MEFAIKLLDLIKQGKRIINVDQTPVGDSVFVTKGWMGKSEKLSTHTHFIKPRITMQCAIGDHGELFFALMQANSNVRTMELFMTHLCWKLDKLRADWRRDTVFQLDGASWHVSKENLAVFEKLKAQLIISGPYSYDGSAIELLFAAMKKGNLNPEGLPMSLSLIHI